MSDRTRLGRKPDRTVEDRDAIHAVYTFGTGAGWHGWMPAGERRKVQVMWNLVLPLIVAIKGYQAWNWLGLGEDLPKGVYRDWKHWCRYPRYFFEDPKMAWLNEHFAAVRTPIVGAVSPPGGRVPAFCSGMGKAILAESGAEVLRWGPPNSAWTMDYREDRVNVRYDDEMKITEITCG